MKKISHLLTAILLAFSLAACAPSISDTPQDMASGPLNQTYTAESSQMESSGHTAATISPNEGSTDKNPVEGESTGGGSASDKSTGGGSAGDDSTGGDSAGDKSTGGGSAGDDSTGGGSAGDKSTGDGSAGDDSTGGNSAGGGSANGNSADNGAMGSNSDSSDGSDSENNELAEDGVYTSKEDVALYIHLYGCLPSNFITKKEAEALGWKGGSLEPFAPGMCIGGNRFGNYEGLLPAKKGRSYTECDIDTLGADKRGAKRIVFSNDGLIYYTEDHYESFELLYGDP